MSSFVNVFGGGLVQPSFSSYSVINLNYDISLAWSTDFGNNPLVVSSIMDVYPSQNGFSIRMPNSLNVSVGFSFSINNRTAFSFTLLSNDGVTPITVVSPQSFNEFYLTDNTTANGNWTLIPSTGTSAVTSIGLNTAGAASSNLSITSTTTNPITLAGTFSIELTGDLEAISSLSSPGLVVRKGDASWGVATITGTNNQISVTRGNGVDGSPVIALATNISGISSINLVGGNIAIGVTPNVIAANNVDGSLSLRSQGTGSVSLSATGSGSILLTTASGFVGVNCDIFLTDESGVSFGDSGSKTVKLVAPTTIANSYTVKLPGSIPADNQCLGVSSVVGTVVETDWLNIPNITETTIVNTIPYFTSTTGSSASTTITVTGDDGSGHPTGITLSGAGILAVGNISIQTNTISSGSGDIILSPVSPNVVAINSNTAIKGGSQLRLYNAANTFYYSFLAQPGLAANYLAQLPLNNGSDGGLLTTNGANPATLAWSNSISGITGVTFSTGGSGNIAMTATAITNVSTLAMLAAGGISFATGMSISATAITNISGTISFGANNLVLSPAAIYTSGATGLTIGTNSVAAITIDTSQNVSISGNATLEGKLSTAPGVATSSAAGFSLGTPYQNTSGYDIMLVLYIDVSAGGTTFTFSVSPTSITTGSSIATTGTQLYTIPLYVPKNYYAYVNTAGGTASLSLAQAIPI